MSDFHDKMREYIIWQRTNHISFMDISLEDMETKRNDILEEMKNYSSSMKDYIEGANERFNIPSKKI